MSTRLENLARIRTLLDTPYPSRPDYNTLFQLELATEADVLNETTNTDRPWAVNTFTLNYTPGQDAYEITNTDFAKPLLMTRILTGNPYITRMPVPFQDLNHQLYGTIWSTFDAFYQWGWGWEETPERATFYRGGQSNQTYMVSINPQPQTAVQYEITYAPSFQGELDPLENAIQLPEMASLVQLRVATAALPYAAWYEDENENRLKRKDLAQSFAYQLERKEPIYQRYISSIVKPRDVSLDSWHGAF